jgi:hypothetical protein
MPKRTKNIFATFTIGSGFRVKKKRGLMAKRKAGVTSESLIL